MRTVNSSASGRSVSQSEVLAGDCAATIDRSPAVSKTISAKTLQLSNDMAAILL